MGKAMKQPLKSWRCKAHGNIIRQGGQQGLKLFLNRVQHHLWGAHNLSADKAWQEVKEIFPDCFT